MTSSPHDVICIKCRKPADHDIKTCPGDGQPKPKPRPLNLADRILSTLSGAKTKLLTGPEHSIESAP